MTRPEKVLSPVKIAPICFALTAKSPTRVVGLAGVSTWISLVLGRTAAWPSAGLVVSTRVSSTPKRSAKCSTRNPWMPMEQIRELMR